MTNAPPALHVGMDEVPFVTHPAAGAKWNRAPRVELEDALANYYEDCEDAGISCPNGLLC